MIGEIKDDIKNQTNTYIIGALGLVAGLAWNDAVKALIEHFFPLSKDSIGVKFLYALAVTILVILLTKYIFKPSVTK